jgi:hypothetical protein
MRKLFASAYAFTVVITMIVVAPSIAQAAQTRKIAVTSIQPYTAQGFSVNTCVFLSTPSGGTVVVQGWAYSTSFYGYFRLTTPSGTFYSATQTWLGGKGNYTQWSGVSAIVGQYCVTGFTSTGINQGTACEWVS